MVDTGKNLGAKEGRGSNGSNWLTKARASNTLKMLVTAVLIPRKRKLPRTGSSQGLDYHFTQLAVGLAYALLMHF